MEKTIGALIDELSITNNKIFYLVEKVQKNKHTRADAKKIQDLNSYRSKLVSAINEYFNDEPQIKVSPSVASIGLTFIAKPLFFKPGLNGGVYPVRISSRSRGEEIAQYLEATYSTDGKYDPNNICIYLKPRSLEPVRDNIDYVDILDDIKIIQMLKTRPKIKVIAYNKPYYDFLKKELKNEIILIPHPHINFENQKRSKNKSLVGGMIGKSSPLSYPTFNAIKERLAKVGIEFKECFTYQSRQELLDFYNQVDFHVIWYDTDPEDTSRFFRHPGKIINAASFGAPTIAQKIIGHQEVEGYYLEAANFDEIAKAAVKLKDEAYYNQLSEKLLKMANDYHISKVAELYKKLC